MNVKRLVVLALAAAFVLQLQILFVNAQEPDETMLTLETPLRFSHVDADDGLAQNKVNGIVQDNLGFMWLVWLPASLSTGS